MADFTFESYLQDKFNFRYNVVTHRISYKLLSEQDYRILDDRSLNTIWRDLTNRGLKCSPTTLHKLLYSDFSERHCPFAEYFCHLPSWKEAEDPDYINLLAETVETTQQETWLAFFKKWLVAAVASILDEDVVNHTAIIFSGRQGVGKTRWLNALVPEPLKSYSYCGYLNLDNKDADLQLSECFLINLDELANMTRRSLDKLKIMITKDRIRQRRAYGYFIENYPRRASFCGSTNGNQFLLDTSGNRRFLCFQVLGINLDVSVDLDLVYAQALALYRSGFRYWFNEIEIEEVNRSNSQFERTTLEEEELLNYFEPCKRENATDILMTSEIAERLANYGGKVLVNNASLRHLGEALGKHEFERFKHKGRYKYALRLKVEKSLSIQGNRGKKVLPNSTDSNTLSGS